MTDEVNAHQPSTRSAATAPGAARWLNGAVTGTLLASVLVAALRHGGLPPDPIYDVIWIVITLAGTGLVRAYSAFVVARGQREPIRRTALRTLSGEWSLIMAGLPAVAILLGSTAGWYPARAAIRTVLGTNVAMLLGWGSLGARQAGYRPMLAAAIGLTDATLGMLIVLANVLVK